MISTILSQFIKDFIDIPEVADSDNGQSCAIKISRVLAFTTNILQQSKDYLHNVQLTEEVKESLYDNLLKIDNEISELMVRLKPENDKSSGEEQTSDDGKISDAGSDTKTASPPAIHQLSHLLQSDLRNYNIHSLEVTAYNSLSEIVPLDTEREKCNLRLMEFQDSVIVNGELALNRILWNSMERYDRTRYWCQLCSQQVLWQKGCKVHINSTAHVSKVAAAKVCISSLGVYSNILVDETTAHTMQCCVCTTKYAVADGVEHNESANHKRALSAAKAKCIYLLERLEKVLNHTETDNRALYEKMSETCQEHKIILIENELKCEICNVNLKFDMRNLFEHINDHNHRQLHHTELKQKYNSLVANNSVTTDKIYRGFITIYNTKNASYCSICSVLFLDVSIDKINKHIESLAHNIFLSIYLRNEDRSPSINLHNRDSNETNQEMIEYSADTDEYYTQDKDEPRWRYQDESKVVVDGKIIINKFSWHVMTHNDETYFCSPCNLNVNEETFAQHVETKAHRDNLKDWPLSADFRKHLIREYLKIGIAYCIVCKVFLGKHGLKDHVESKDHGTQFEKLTSDCTDLNTSFNDKYIKETYPNFKDGSCKVFQILLRQNLLNFHSNDNRMYCDLCKEDFDHRGPKDLQHHIVRTGHFKRFVANKSINCLYENPNFYRGFILDVDRPDKAYCLICNLHVPMSELVSHWKGSVHNATLPFFIDNVFSHHNIVYSDDYVFCKLCNEKLCDNELDLKIICSHVKNAKHLSKFEIVLKHKFRKVTGCHEDVKLELEGTRVDRFEHLNAAYCQLCNIVFNVEPSSEPDLTAANLCEHRFSKIHYIFKHNLQKGSNSSLLVAI